jgi:uncharacterized protein YjbI with pentapeptide repeats
MGTQPAEKDEPLARRAPDIQAALDVLGWRTRAYEQEDERLSLWHVNLYWAHLSWANLERADLGGANLRRADLRHAQLQRVDFWGAYLENADFEWANLKEANLKQAQLQGANLWGAHLEGAFLGGTDLKGAFLGEAYLKGVKPSAGEDFERLVEQLVSVKTLYRAILDPQLEERLKQRDRERYEWLTKTQ